MYPILMQLFLGDELVTEIIFFFMKILSLYFVFYKYLIMNMYYFHNQEKLKVLESR